MATSARNGGSARSVSPTRTPRPAPGPAVTPPPASTAAPRPAPPPQRQSSAMESKPAAGQVSRQQVAEAAYFLWLQRGGNDLVNWLDAEAILTARAAQRSSR